MGDIIKFGRVPFKIKESSVRPRPTTGRGANDESHLEQSLEKNITDIESIEEPDLNNVL